MFFWVLYNCCNPDDPHGNVTSNEMLNFSNENNSIFVTMIEGKMATKILL